MVWKHSLRDAEADSLPQDGNWPGFNLKRKNDASCAATRSKSPFCALHLSACARWPQTSCRTSSTRVKVFVCFDMCFKTSVCQCLCCWFVMYFKTSWLCLQDRWQNSNDDDVLINTAKPYSVINIGYSNDIGDTHVVRTSVREGSKERRRIGAFERRRGTGRRVGFIQNTARRPRRGG